jgi:diguanylate cyclase (GGDEF)-like protein
LTQTLNREGFMATARDVISRAQRYGTAYAVAFLDVDRFKQLNDGSGHVYGDKALEHAAKAMLANIRKGDIVGRLGGDEFAIVMPEISEEAAEQTLTKILNTAATPPDAQVKSAPSTPTLSAGLLYVPPRSPTLPLETLISMSDALMYQAKRAGGNRLSKATPQTAPKVQSA